MDYEAEIDALAAETLALQAIVTNVFLQIGKEDVVLSLAIRRGLDDAANQIENFPSVSAKRPGPIMLSKPSALSRNCGPHLLAIKTSLNTLFKSLGFIFFPQMQTLILKTTRSQYGSPFDREQ